MSATRAVTGKMDAFSRCHPAICFAYFIGVIVFTAIGRHPAWLVASLLAALLYYFLLRRRQALRQLLSALPLFALLCVLNPLFVTQGDHVLFVWLGRNFTLEALAYGVVIGGMFVAMIFWFGCYNRVMTSDKFTTLFGGIAPSLSLLLVMVLRLIPELTRRTAQLRAARRCVGKGAEREDKLRERLNDGMGILSALTDRALESSVVTADSMRARGYGCAKRASFQIYRMTARDAVLLVVILLLWLTALLFGARGAEFYPDLQISALNWAFFPYCAYLLLPSALHIKEAVQWHILRSKL